MIPLSKVVLDFESDTRRRSSQGQNLSLTLFLLAMDDAVEQCDHIGLTLLRNRLKEALEFVEAGKFRLLLNQLMLEIQLAERNAVRQLIPEKKNKFEHHELLAKARRALLEDREQAPAEPVEPLPVVEF